MAVIKIQKFHSKMYRNSGDIFFALFLNLAQFNISFSNVPIHRPIHIVISLIDYKSKVFSGWEFRNI